MHEIEDEEGDVEITTTREIIGSIVQNCGASVSFGDENANVQVVENSQIADIVIDGNENEFEFEQSLEQSAFSPEVSTDLTQTVAQAYWVFVPYWGWVLVYF